MRKITKILFACSIFISAGCVGSTASEPGKPQSQSKENAIISYLGPEGTYTEEAAKFFFKDSDTFVPKQNVDETIKDVMDGVSDYGVVPQENTIGGPVTNYIDALISQTDVYVVGEIVIPISQTLMGMPDAQISDIKVVCSHAQGLAQTKEWRKENMQDAVEQEMDSTAAAASYVAQTQDPSIAAIAAPGAADIYGLTVLAENVQISDTNKTRFYVLAKESFEKGGYTHAVFVAACPASRIDDIIVEINKTGLELVLLHDRPEGSKLGMYYYVIEVEKEEGISSEQIDTIEKIEEVRYAGTFDTVNK